jgi:hypothetical protein
MPLRKLTLAEVHNMCLFLGIDLAKGPYIGFVERPGHIELWKGARLVAEIPEYDPYVNPAFAISSSGGPEENSTKV